MLFTSFLRISSLPQQTLISLKSERGISSSHKDPFLLFLVAWFELGVLLIALFFEVGFSWCFRPAGFRKWAITIKSTLWQSEVWILYGRKMVESPDSVAKLHFRTFLPCPTTVCSYPERCIESNAVFSDIAGWLTRMDHYRCKTLQSKAP